MGVSDGVCRGFITSRQLATNAAYFIRIYFLSPPRGYIRSQQPAKIAAYFVCIFTQIIKIIHQFATYFSQLRQLFQNLLKTLGLNDDRVTSMFETLEKRSSKMSTIA